MNLAVCSLTIGEQYKKTVLRCSEKLSKYCQKYNYPLITEETYVIKDRDYMWSKVPLIRKTLLNYDYVFWIDADMMIMNENIRLEHFIELYLGNKETMMSIDGGGQINTGFWVLKNTPYIHRLLELIENLPEIAGMYHEQGVFNNMYNKNTFNLREHSRIIPEIEQRLFNSTIYNYKKGDFIIHFLGIGNLDNLKKVCEDHYPDKKADETNDYYQYRMKFLEERYKINNSPYISSPPKVKVEVCTYYSGEKYEENIIHYGQQTIIKYCTKNNYKYHVEKETLVPDLPPHWTKIALLLRIANNCDSDYIVWLDADIMIMNQDIKIETIIEERMNGKDFLLSRDISGEINTGVWIVRNTQYAKSVLELILNLPELRYRGYEDQDVFNKVYTKNLLQFQNKCTILPVHEQGVMNSCVGLFKWGFWLIHFFSLSKEGLSKAFNDFYPFQKHYEDENMYKNRMTWLKNR